MMMMTCPGGKTLTVSSQPADTTILYKKLLWDTGAVEFCFQLVVFEVLFHCQCISVRGGAVG
jgi:hypothetical protein